MLRWDLLLAVGALAPLGAGANCLVNAGVQTCSGNIDGSGQAVLDTVDTSLLISQVGVNLDSIGLSAQGAGGTGGGSATLSSSTGQGSLWVAVGGSGGKGGNASAVTLTSDGAISTQAARWPSS